MAVQRAVDAHRAPCLLARMVVPHAAPRHAIRATCRLQCSIDELGMPPYKHMPAPGSTARGRAHTHFSVVGFGTPNACAHDNGMFLSQCHEPELAAVCSSGTCCHERTVRVMHAWPSRGRWQWPPGAGVLSISGPWLAWRSVTQAPRAQECLAVPRGARRWKVLATKLAAATLCMNWHAGRAGTFLCRHAAAAVQQLPRPNGFQA